MYQLDDTPTRSFLLSLYSMQEKLMERFRASGIQMWAVDRKQENLFGVDL